MVKQFFLEEIAKVQIGHLIANDQWFKREGTPFITKATLLKLLVDDDASKVPKVDHTVDSLYLSM